MRQIDFPLSIARSEENLMIKAPDGSPDIYKRYSAIDGIFIEEKNTASLKKKTPTRQSLSNNGGLKHINSFLEDSNKIQETIPRKFGVTAISVGQFNEKQKQDTSSLLMVNKEKEKSMGSKTSVIQESKTHTKKNRTKKNLNSMVNEQNSGIMNLNSKTSVGEKQTQNTTLHEEHLGLFDKVASFKNYFPESNVRPVLDIYDKKRKKLMFLNEMKMLNPGQTSNIVLRKGTHIIPGPNNNYDQINDKEIILQKWGKYTFYPHRMQEKTNINRRNKSPIFKKRRKEPKLMLEKRKSVFGVSMSKKSNFFGELIVNNGAKKGFTDFVFDIMRDPRFAKWKKMKKNRRLSEVFKKN